MRRGFVQGMGGVREHVGVVGDAVDEAAGPEVPEDALKDVALQLTQGGHQNLQPSTHMAQTGAQHAVQRSHRNGQ